MPELAWPVGAAVVLGVCLQFGGLAVFVIVGVAGILVLKALGDQAGRR